MKHSYPDSLITLSAAITNACLANKQLYNNNGTGIKSKKSKLVKLNTVKALPHERVGINFANISAGNYFTLLKTNHL